tara:strand:+ start:1569 stop:1784 length:216 start_codon:yes stop_codon:yes gene_type:complete
MANSDKLKAVLKKKKAGKKLTKKEKLMISNIPGVKYKGSGKDPAMNELLKKLKKGGADSLDSSGMGTRWKV